MSAATLHFSLLKHEGYIEITEENTCDAPPDTDPERLFERFYRGDNLGFYIRLCNEGLAAKVIVDYAREPFVFGPGNVRVTLDYNIRTALRCTDFLNPRCVTIPVPGSPCILEVKWDNYLPDVIRDMAQLGNRHSTAYSKYAACRMYD